MAAGSSYHKVEEAVRGINRVRLFWREFPRPRATWRTPGLSLPDAGVNHARQAPNALIVAQDPGSRTFRTVSLHDPGAQEEEEDDVA